MRGRQKSRGGGSTDMRMYNAKVTGRECGGGGARGEQRAVEGGSKRTKGSRWTSKAAVAEAATEGALATMQGRKRTKERSSRRAQENKGRPKGGRKRTKGGRDTREKGNKERPKGESAGEQEAAKRQRRKRAQEIKGRPKGESAAAHALGVQRIGRLQKKGGRQTLRLAVGSAWAKSMR